jgi:hypothetical protein
MATNFWFSHIIDAYLKACAEGRDWREACREAERAIGDGSRSVLTSKDLRTKKGISWGRQHISRKVRDGTFPRPFQAPVAAE